MIAAELFLNECKKRGYTLFSGTPCSYLKPFINNVIEDENLEYREVTNEGDAVALASGAWLGGRKSIVMFQNSGLGNAVNPLTSLSKIMNIPFIGIVTLRGEVGGASDEPQHKLMGKITTKMLDLMEIPWSYFPDDSTMVEAAFTDADNTSIAQETPFFFVMKKGSVEPYELREKFYNIPKASSSPEVISHFVEAEASNRTHALQSILKSTVQESIMIATTGKTGRELFEIDDRHQNLYLVGSMGCASSLGLGLSLSTQNKAICVIDGDGALLMRLGNMASIGQHKPTNFIHILLDNSVHDSTGGQRSLSEEIDFSQIASSCGYEKSYQTNCINSLGDYVLEAQRTKALTFIRFFICSGSPKELGRPTVTPAEVAKRLKYCLESM